MRACLTPSLALFYQDGSTALLLTAWKGHDECMALLVDAGAVLDVKDSDGTALDAAKKYNHPKCVAILEGVNAP